MGTIKKKVDHFAKINFGLILLNGMLARDKNFVKQVFKEARKENLLPKKELVELEKEALEILPDYKLFYDLKEVEKLELSHNFREKIMNKFK